MRLLRLLPIAALLIAPASPMAAPPQARPDRAGPAVDPDRFCRRFVEGYREREERSYARSNMAYAPLAAPPPPPPPAAPPPPPPPPPPARDSGSDQQPSAILCLAGKSHRRLHSLTRGPRTLRREP